jgi:adenylate cyclase class IV
MKNEIEFLFFDIDKQALRKNLQIHGAQKIYDEFLQKRVVFDFGSKDDIFSWTRIRQEKDKVVMSYKETKKGEFAKEVEVIVSDFDDAVKILTLSGVKPTSIQENYREKYLFKNSEIVIDTWPWLETVAEVESPDEIELKEIIELLDLNTEKSIKGSINNVYKFKYGKWIQELTEEQQMKFKFDEENQFLL